MSINTAPITFIDGSYRRVDHAAKLASMGFSDLEGLANNSFLETPTAVKLMEARYARLYPNGDEDHVHYDVRLKALGVQRTKLEAKLWAAQLAAQPSSVHVTRGEALQWMYSDGGGVVEVSGSQIGKTMRQLVGMHEKWCTARALVVALAHDVGIFYTVGTAKGFRYGLLPHETLNGFTR